MFKRINENKCCHKYIFFFIISKESWQVIGDDVNQTLTVFTLKSTDVLGSQVQVV